VLLLEFAHIGFDVIVDFEAVGFQMTDPFFAATAIGIAVNLDRDQVGGLGQGGDEQGAQGDQTQVGSHGESRLELRPKKCILTIFFGLAFKECFEVIQNWAALIIVDQSCQSDEAHITRLSGWRLSAFAQGKAGLSLEQLHDFFRVT
jgi:hypothetical protein